MWNAFRVGLTLCSVARELRLNVFLLGDGVVAAKKGQKPPEGYNLGKMAADLVARGVKVAACGTCIRARGLTEEDLLEGVEVGTMTMLAKWVEESQKVLSF